MLSCKEDLVDVALSSSDNCAYDVVPLAFDNQESGHGLDAIGSREFRSLININFQQGDSSVFVFLFDIGSNVLARAAPGGMAVNHCDSAILVEEVLNLL